MQYQKDRLPAYIKSTLANGYSIKSIRKALLAHGYDAKVVNELISRYKRG